MRWKYDDFEPYLGHIRVVDKFLFFPRWIKGEARWLERVKIKQEYKHIWTIHQFKYVDIEWVDD